MAGRAQGDDRDERVRARHRQAGPALRRALPLSRARSRRTIRKPVARDATASRRSARCSIASRTRRVQSYFLGGKYPEVEEAAKVALVLEQYPLGERGAARRRWPNESGVRASQGAHRARAAQAARPRARASRRRMGAVAEPPHVACDLSADLTDYEERRVAGPREAPGDDRRTARARSAGRASSSSTSARPSTPDWECGNCDACDAQRAWAERARRAVALA